VSAQAPIALMADFLLSFIALPLAQSFASLRMPALPVQWWCAMDSAPAQSAQGCGTWSLNCFQFSSSFATTTLPT